MQQVKQGFVIPFLGILLVSAFIMLAFFTTYKKTNETVGLMIADNVAQLGAIFAKIHKTCGILSFDFQKNPINFLNVKTFSGSHVGSMNLRFPKKWRGPYVRANALLSPNDYQIIRTHTGYFITPAEGTILPNGLVIGKDIILNDYADIMLMTQPRGVLNYQGKALAMFINTEIQELSNLVGYEVE